MVKPSFSAQERRAVILVVDDEPMNIEILSDILEVDHDILFATSGADALALAESEQPDLILLDVMMPEMNGYETCARLRDNSLTAAIPIVFVTALSTPEDEAKGLEVGAIDYVIKPISPPIVKARVRNLLELKRSRDFWERMSSVDALTGIANRRQFDTVVENEWRRAKRIRQSFGLMLLDVDFFKKYNDTYGHGAGDTCLMQVAGALNATILRPADLCARYGGEEFVCVLPDTPQQGVAEIAERVRDAVESLDIAHKGSAIANHVSVSIGGISVVADFDLTVAQLIEAADKNLYQAKESGRNRCVISAL